VSRSDCSARLQVSVLGMDGGALRTDAARVLAGATLVVGGARHLAAADLPDGVPTVILGGVTPAVEQIAGHRGRAVVLASGDPGLFGIVRALRAAGLDPQVHPALSSVALSLEA